MCIFVNISKNGKMKWAVMPEAIWADAFNIWRLVRHWFCICPHNNAQRQTIQFRRL